MSGVSGPCDRKFVEDAAGILLDGGVVAFPTETSYGLGASVHIPQAMERIYEIKHRERSKPLLVLLPEISHLDSLAEQVPDVAFTLIERFWPGPLTLIFKAKSGLPWPLCASTGKIGVRISSHPCARALLRAVGHPVTATSANVSGAPPAATAGEVAKFLQDPAPDMILDGGRVPGAPPSTILDVSVNPPRLLRAGAIDPEDIPVLHEKGPA